MNRVLGNTSSETDGALTLVVVIVHGDGYRSLFGHLVSSECRYGRTVFFGHHLKLMRKRNQYAVYTTVIIGGCTEAVMDREICVVQPVVRLTVGR